MIHLPAATVRKPYVIPQDKNGISAPAGLQRARGVIRVERQKQSSVSTAGVKLITAEQRAECAALAAIYRDRFRLCTPDQRALAETFRLGAVLLQELSE